jgi:alkylated DNA nucleotide flippase Atl1
MNKSNTIRNYRIASLYGRMSYGKIAKIIGCSRSCVAGVVRHHVLKVPRDHVAEYWRWRKDDGRSKGYRDDVESLPPSVAYVKGLEAFGNGKYRMIHHG